MVDYHTQTGFSDLQLRLRQALNTLANENGVRLINVIWMDGTMSLPKSKGPVTLTIVQSSGEQESVTLNGPELTAWLDGRWSRVDRKLDHALEALKSRTPK